MTDEEHMHPLQEDATIEALSQKLYGSPLPRIRGIAQVVSAVERQGALFVPKIEPGTPKSKVDLFVLSLARARADVVVLTGKILREEPELHYEPTLHDESSALVETLIDFRKSTLGFSTKPLLAVLTSGCSFPQDHVALRGRECRLFTSKAGVSSLDNIGCSVEILEEPSITAVVSWLWSRGYRSILIEAGPSTAKDLYQDAPVDPAVDTVDPAVDTKSAHQVRELLLSTLKSDMPIQMAGKLLDSDRLHRAFRATSAGLAWNEPNGAWLFRRMIHRDIL
ncbi:MAG: hypothetical protein AAF355_12060 [Myxococcota bacterium]